MRKGVERSLSVTRVALPKLMFPFQAVKIERISKENDGDT